MKTYCGCDNGPIGSDEKIDLEWDNKIVPVIGSGTDDYNDLINKPSINGVTLQGNKTNDEILISGIPNTTLEKLLK